MNKVFLLVSDWNYHGNTGVNEAVGVFSSLEKAQIALCHKVFENEKTEEFSHTTMDGLDISEINIAMLAHEDKPLPTNYVQFWNGDDIDFSEDWVSFSISEYEVE